METSTPPRMTFRYGSFRDNVVEIRLRQRELAVSCSKIRVRRSRDERVLTILSSDGGVFTVVNVEVDEEELPFPDQLFIENFSNSMQDSAVSSLVVSLLHKTRSINQSTLKNSSHLFS